MIPANLKEDQVKSLIQRTALGHAEMPANLIESKQDEWDQGEIRSNAAILVIVGLRGLVAAIIMTRITAKNGCCVIVA